jgi:hypothetical protein
MQYSAPLLNTPGAGSVHGKVSVDTTGNTTVTLSGAGASNTYTLQFCTALDSDYQTQGAYAPDCFDVTTVTTDATGDGTATVKFPRPGDWAGDFSLNNSSGKAVYRTTLSPTLSNETYFSTLLPDTKTDGGMVTTLSAQAPLTSGTVTYSNGTLQFTVKGASPNTSYYTSSSENVYIDSSGSYQLTTFTTDASGNGSSTFAWANLSPGGDLFQVGQSDMSSTEAGYIGGFVVPQ